MTRCRLKQLPTAGIFPLAIAGGNGLAGWQNRIDMNVSMWMTREVLTVGPDTSVTEAARLMAEKKIRRLLVAEKWGDGLHLLGIASAKDVLHAFPPHVNPFAVSGPGKGQSPAKISEIMTPSPRTVSPETPIEEAAALMCGHKIGALPVLRERVIAGIITESDIFRAFTSLFHAEEKGARITFDATREEDIFNLLDAFTRRHAIKISSLIRTVHDEIPVCVVRVSGDGVDKMLEELWNSGHAVVNVIRFDEAKEKQPEPSAAAIIEPRKPRAKGLDVDLYSSG